jgi:hypothetical protein
VAQGLLRAPQGTHGLTFLNAYTSELHPRGSLHRGGAIPTRLASPASLTLFHCGVLPLLRSRGRRTPTYGQASATSCRGWGTWRRACRYVHSPACHLQTEARRLVHLPKLPSIGPWTHATCWLSPCGCVQAQSKKAKFFLLLDRRSSWF